MSGSLTQADILQELQQGGVSTERLHRLQVLLSALQHREREKSKRRWRWVVTALCSAAAAGLLHILASSRDRLVNCVDRNTATVVTALERTLPAVTHSLEEPLLAAVDHLAAPLEAVADHVGDQVDQELIRIDPWVFKRNGSNDNSPHGGHKSSNSRSSSSSGGHHAAAAAAAHRSQEDRLQYMNALASGRTQLMAGEVCPCCHSKYAWK